MRRRIYIDPEGDLCDDTTRAYLFSAGDLPSGGRFEKCDRGALYDEELWSRYLAACEEANTLRMQVIEALVHEPYDDIERDAHRRMRSEIPRDEQKQIEAELLAHAATRERPP